MITLADGMNVIKESEGQSTAHLFMKMAQLTQAEGSPERLYHEWLHAHQANVRAGITELGLELPEPGPRLALRIKNLVMPELVRRHKEQQS